MDHFSDCFFISHGFIATFSINSESASKTLSSPPDPKMQLLNQYLPLAFYRYLRVSLFKTYIILPLNLLFPLCSLSRWIISPFTQVARAQKPGSHPGFLSNYQVLLTFLPKYLSNLYSSLPQGYHLGQSLCHSLLPHLLCSPPKAITQISL